MMRTVERIEQELARLDQAVATIAQEFHDTYRQYLTTLGQAVRQQLVVASYHVCTHAYPERFLNLSLAQRQQLQQSLRQLAKAAQPQLLQLLQASNASTKSTKASAIASAASLLDLADLAILQELGDEVEREISREVEREAEKQINRESDETINHDSSEEGNETAAIESSAEDTQNVLNAQSNWLEAIEAASLQTVDFSAIESLSPDLSGSNPFSESLESHSSEFNSSEADSFADSAETPETTGSSEGSPSSSDQKPALPSHPKDLLQWQEQLEEGIIETLQNLSHNANRLLQQSEVLSGHLPEPVLEVASKADIATEATASPPNLLHLLIETDGEEEKEPTMTQLMAIRLRLSEIEFSDSPTTVWRSKIRDLSSQLNKLGRDYQKKQKERSIAEAEAAWRSSWFED